MSRPVLRLRLNPQPESSPSGGNAEATTGQGAEIEELIAGAIALKRCLQARYNNGDVVLQPCLLYRENDIPFLLAVTASRDGKPPREPKLGTFRLAGLNELKRSEEVFIPDQLHRSWTARPNWDVVAGLRTQPIAVRARSA